MLRCYTYQGLLDTVLSFFALKLAVGAVRVIWIETITTYWIINYTLFHAKFHITKTDTRQLILAVLITWLLVSTSYHKTIVLVICLFVQCIWLYKHLATYWISKFFWKKKINKYSTNHRLLHLSHQGNSRCNDHTRAPWVYIFLRDIYNTDVSNHRQAGFTSRVPCFRHIISIQFNSLFQHCPLDTRFFLPPYFGLAIISTDLAVLAYKKLSLMVQYFCMPYHLVNLFFFRTDLGVVQATYWKSSAAHGKGVVKSGRPVTAVTGASQNGSSSSSPARQSGSPSHTYKPFALTLFELTVSKKFKSNIFRW